MSETKKTGQTVQTTGHAWDGDIQEYNNPIPRWWLWSFYATVIFAIVYWIFYPAWPIGHSYTPGVMNTITYTVNGEEKTTHWNTRALLVRDMQTGEAAVKQRKHMQEVANASFSAILSDPKMIDFSSKIGKVLFEDNCAACHGMGGQGVVGLFPNLVDDDWLWGGRTEDIQNTISAGHIGFMPAFDKTFSEQQMDDVTEFVLSLSGQAKDKERVARGKVLFTGEGGGCYYCHNQQGTGIKSVGSANLTDHIWTIADVASQKDIMAKRTRVREVISHGVNRTMPTWKGRLSDEEIKLLTVYVYNLSGGK
ncbi:MAG TPA: cytochrome-c oxidase, cbb3-type subunit III [Gammaproteobacteria bacterium]|nr:cytochrome-c oxidase, cbb3-type subunit III [Gammaproteobacteria bacterium]